MVFCTFCNLYVYNGFFSRPYRQLGRTILNIIFCVYNYYHKSRCVIHFLFEKSQHLEDQVKTVSFVSSLPAELVQAQLYIHDLEYEVKSSRKKVKYLLRKLGEERTLQQKKEHDKIYALIDDLKGRLSREIKKQQRMDIINSQLVKELTEAKLSAMQLVQKYEEEKRARELLEEV